MGDQAGIPNAFTANRATPDLHSYRKHGSDSPANTYAGLLSQAGIAVGTVTKDIIALTPIVMPRGIFINKFAYRVTVNQVGSKFKVALYNSELSTRFPSTLLTDYGEFSTAVNGTFWSGAVNTHLYAGYMYWIAVWLDTAGVWMAALEGTDRIGIVGYNAAGSVENHAHVGYKYPKVYNGILPDPFPNYGAGSRMLPSNEYFPSIFIRFHDIY